MGHDKWCEHSELTSKYSLVKYRMNDEELVMRVQTWICPECGVHGAHTEIVKPECRREQG